MKYDDSIEKTGLKKFGYIPERDYRLNELFDLKGDGIPCTIEGIDEYVNEADPILLNNRGFDNYHGDPIKLDYAAYQLIPTGLKTIEDRPIFGFFVVDKKHKSFVFVCWGTREGLKQRIKNLSCFHIGEIYFDSLDSGNAFLSSVAERAIPEPWTFKKESAGVTKPILRSYIENVLIKLHKEAASGAANKLIYTKDRRKVLFNTNLLDIYSHDIFVVANVNHLENGDEFYTKPSISEGTLSRSKAGFSKDARPEPAEFFQDVSEVIFQTNWAVDEDFATYRHIIEDRKNRFPAKYQDKSPDELARTLKASIDFAITLSKRNYKFIVPMYRPQIDAIQLLMPIYLNASLESTPDFALVLTPNPQYELYEPETILPLRAVYNNARLIAKPDETWLNPSSIFISGSSEEDD